jgi:hypothetical protein
MQLLGVARWQRRVTAFAQLTGADAKREVLRHGGFYPNLTTRNPQVCAFKA